MDIKTCEQYVLMQLSNKEKEVDSLTSKFNNLQSDFDSTKNALEAELAHKEEIIQKCIQVIQLAHFKVPSTYNDYICTDCFKLMSEENVKSLVDFIVNELHIEIQGYTPSEE